MNNTARKSDNVIDFNSLRDNKIQQSQQLNISISEYETLRKEIRAELREEIRAELLVELRAELETEIRTEIANEQKNEKKPQKTAKLKKDGTEKKTHSNRIKLTSTEVYSFKSKDEIDKVLNVFDMLIEQAKQSKDIKRIRAAVRNKLLFQIGINASLRISDLVRLKWGNIIKRINKDGSIEFHDFSVIYPKKTEKKRKSVKVFYNDAIKKVVTDYINGEVEDYTGSLLWVDLNEYCFPNYRKKKPVDETTGEDVEHISEANAWDMMKNVARLAGIEQNIGTHSFRKTWGYWRWHEAEDKNKALVMLCSCFNHSSPQVTMRYIGLLDEEIEEMYNSVNLGV